MNNPNWTKHNRVQDALLDLEKSVAFGHRMVLTQVILRKTPAGWQAIIKGNVQGKPLCAFLDTNTFGELVQIVAEETENSRLRLYPDRYPPRSLEARPAF